MQERCHLIVSGHVQGVCYRMYARDEAQRLALTGWVRNKPDGTVEIMIEGEPDALCKMLAWSLAGPPMARVTGVKDSFSAATGKFKEFKISY